MFYRTCIALTRISSYSADARLDATVAAILYRRQEATTDVEVGDKPQHRGRSQR
jgi:hypothetical protein